MAIVESIQKQLDAENYTAGVFVDLKKSFWPSGSQHFTWETCLLWY